MIKEKEMIAISKKETFSLKIFGYSIFDHCSYHSFNHSVIVSSLIGLFFLTMNVFIYKNLFKNIAYSTGALSFDLNIFSRGFQDGDRSNC